MNEDTAMLKTIFEVSRELRIDWQTARDWIEEGTIPTPILVGNRLRFRQVDLDEWVKAGCPKTAEPPEAACERFWDALLAELESRRVDSGRYADGATITMR